MAIFKDLRYFCVCQSKGDPLGKIENGADFVPEYLLSLPEA